MKLNPTPNVILTAIVTDTVRLRVSEMHVSVWLTRVGTIAVLSALLAGCAIVYRDAETGATHAWGTAHLVARATAPNEGKKAVVYGVTTYGLAIGIWDRMPFIVLGWQRMQTAEVVDENTAVRIEAPQGDLLQMEVGSTPPKLEAREKQP